MSKLTSTESNIELSETTDKQKNDDVSFDESLNEQPINYETAVSLVGFGKFNYYLILLCIPTGLACIFATSTISYVLSQAQCDLELSLENKGMLNAVTYIGMISSGIMWGTLADNYGRRIVLMSALSMEAICAVVAALSNTYWLLLTAKYFSGFMICGPVALQLTYMSEFHHSQFRPKLITIIGVYLGLAKILLPLLAWLLMPLHLHIVVISGFIELKSWQCYLLVCSIPSIFACIIHFFLPESPKFLMTKGRYNEAMKIFVKMYSKNKGKNLKTLPFSRLIDDTYEDKELKFNGTLSRTSEDIKKFKLMKVLEEIKPIFIPPHVYKLMIVAWINFGCLLGSITLRLWLPQMLATMDEYNQSHNSTDETTLCDMLDYSPKKSIITIGNITQTEICIIPELSTETYLNNIIVPICSITLYFIVGFIVNKIGKKNILITLPLLGGLTILSNYFSKNSFTTVMLSSIFLAFVSVNSMVCTSVAIELFPTNLRAKALSLMVIFGRMGPLVGNVSFPFLFYSGCLTPFIFIASFSFLCTALSLLLPNTERKPLI